MSEYNQRLKIQRDNYSVMENAKDEGREKGLIEGRMEVRKEMAIKLKNENISLSIISKTTGLTIEEIAIL